MKFKFCLDGDCPLWALAALHALSSLPAPLFLALLQHVVDEQPDGKIMEILKDTSLSSRDEYARAAAVIRWVLAQTWRGACPSAQLTRDLLVLGVPRAHASALAEVADLMRNAYVTHVQLNCFMVTKVTDATISPSPQGTIDTYKLTLSIDDVITGELKRKEVLIQRSQSKTMIVELKRAYKKMGDIYSE